MLKHLWKIRNVLLTVFCAAKNVWHANCEFSCHLDLISNECVKLEADIDNVRIRRFCMTHYLRGDTETLRLYLTDLTYVQSLTSVNYAYKCNIS